LSSSFSCWDANRRSEERIADALFWAWDALIEEDDSEAKSVLNREEEDDGNDGGVGGVIVTCRLGYCAATVVAVG
jgi:hypothetical protein